MSEQYAKPVVDVLLESLEMQLPKLQKEFMRMSSESVNCKYFYIRIHYTLYIFLVSKTGGNTCKAELFTVIGHHILT